MFRKYLSIAFVGLLIFGGNPTLIFAQTQTVNDVSNSARIKAKVLERAGGKKKSVVVEMVDGRKIKGDITQAGDDSFTLIDSKTNQSTVIAYRDAAKVKGSGWPTSAKIALGVGIA